MTYATRHAVSRIGAIVVDQIPGNVTTTLYLYTLLGDSLINKLTVDVPGINARVSASSKYLFCTTQAADLSDVGMAYIFARTETSWTEVQRLSLASKPLAIDSYNDMMLIRFASMVLLYKDGIQDFSFSDLAPIDAKIYDNMISLSTAGAAYLFKKKCAGVWDSYKTYVGNDATFGIKLDIGKKFHAIRDATDIYIYKMKYLDKPVYKISLSSLVEYNVIMGYEDIAIWQPESVVMYDYECGKWIHTKTISMANSASSFVSNGDGITLISKDIGVAGNVSLSVWKRTRRT